MLTIYFVYYNYCRVHQTLRMIPVMEAGLAHTVWTIENWVKLMEPKVVSGWTFSGRLIYV